MSARPQKKKTVENFMMFLNTHYGKTAIYINTTTKDFHTVLNRAAKQPLATQPEKQDLFLFELQRKKHVYFLIHSTKLQDVLCIYSASVCLALVNTRNARKASTAVMSHIIPLSRLEQCFLQTVLRQNISSDSLL